MKRFACGLLIPALLAACSSTPSNETIANSSASGGLNQPRNRAQIHTELGNLYFQRGQRDVALEEANEAIRADPEYPAAHTLRAMIYFELQQFDVAEAGFRTALRLKPNESDTHLNYGVFLCETGRDKEALRSFDLVLKDPLFAAPAGPALNAGLCAVRANDRRSAIRYFEIALRHEPKNMRALYQLAESWLKLGNLASAKIYADSLGRIADPTAETLWLSLRIEHALGDRSAQAALMNQLRRKFPDSQEYRAALQGYYE